MEGKCNHCLICMFSQYMKREGFENCVDVDMDEFFDKTFSTYRKTKAHKEASFFRWNPLNFTNKHFTQKTDNVHDIVS